MQCTLHCEFFMECISSVLRLNSSHRILLIAFFLFYRILPFSSCLLVVTVPHAQHTTYITYTKLTQKAQHTTYNIHNTAKTYNIQYTQHDSKTFF